MKVVVRRPCEDLTGAIVLQKVKEEDIIIGEPAVMSIDGSTTNTGLSILRQKDGALFFSCSLSREDGESAVRYKVKFKKFVERVLRFNKSIDFVYYEEPFVGYVSAIPNLMMLRTSVDELIIENEPEFDYLTHEEINNKRWKKLFLAPDKCPTGTDLEKKAVRAKLESFMPYMKDATQDEIDSYCMGFVAVVHIRNGNEDELKTQKVRPFQYNTAFIGADDDDGMLMEFQDAYKGPASILENGIYLSEIDGRSNFDKYVYKKMGADDKVLIIKFKSKYHGDLILKNRLGVMSCSYDYIYVIVWRKTRK